jgi:hypothetical protein
MVRTGAPAAHGVGARDVVFATAGAPRHVSVFISRAMTVCSSACSSSSVGAPVSTKLGTPSSPHRYTPSHLQHHRDQLGLRGQQHSQRDRQGQHPLAHRHSWNDVVDQMRRGLGHAPRAA